MYTNAQIRSPITRNLKRTPIPEGRKISITTRSEKPQNPNNLREEIFLEPAESDRELKSNHRVCTFVTRRFESASSAIDLRSSFAVSDFSITYNSR